jgi:Outer membrane efflux protein/Putative peptidoglycan binding domain
VIEALDEAKKQGKVRFVGFTGHKNPAIHLKMLAERRPDIAAAERGVAEANEQIGIAKPAFFPTVTLNAFFGFESSFIHNFAGWQSFLWAVGSSLAQTIFDGGRRRATSQAALANYDATVPSYRQATLDAFQQVEDNLAALRILEREGQQQARAVVSARESLQLFTNRYHPHPGTPNPDRINQIKQALTDKGVYSGPIDGVMGTSTRDAIRSFQKRTISMRQLGKAWTTRRNGRWESISRTFLGLFWGCCFMRWPTPCVGAGAMGWAGFNCSTPYK